MPQGDRSYPVTGRTQQRGSQSRRSGRKRPPLLDPSLVPEMELEEIWARWHVLPKVEQTDLFGKKGM